MSDPVDRDAAHEGFKDYAPDVRPRHPDSDDYMAGWREAEAWSHQSSTT